MHGTIEKPAGEISYLADEQRGPRLLLRRLGGRGRPVLYVHGATFPSALSVAYRFSGRSWMDDLVSRGFDSWAFDFAGYGGSDRYAEMSGPQNAAAVGRAPQAAAQIFRVVRHILAVTGHEKLSLIAHSWGTIAAGIFAARDGDLLDKLCFFGPILQRAGTASAAIVPPCWRLLHIEDQLARFIEDVPAAHPPLLIEPALERWGPAYLASDPDAMRRVPPAVKIPNGPTLDIAAAWSGKLAYDPGQIPCPLLLASGEWDSVSSADDASWLISRCARGDVQARTIERGTHLMHLENGRDDLFDVVGEFLSGGAD